jgi:hypothetical protein
MSGGGSGYYGTLGIRYLWTISSLSVPQGFVEGVCRGFKEIVRLSQGKPPSVDGLPVDGLPAEGVSGRAASTGLKRPRPLISGVAVGIAALISLIPFAVIQKAGIKVHFIVSFPLLLLAYHNMNRSMAH